MKIPFLEIGLMNFAGSRGGILIKISPGKESWAKKFNLFSEENFRRIIVLPGERS